MNWILVVVVAGHILTAGVAELKVCEATVAVLAGKSVPAICVAAPVLAVTDGSPSSIWML